MKYKLINLFFKIPFKKVLVFLGIVCVLFLIVYPPMIHRYCSRSARIDAKNWSNKVSGESIAEHLGVYEYYYKNCHRSWGLK